MSSDRRLSPNTFGPPFNASLIVASGRERDHQARGKLDLELGSGDMRTGDDTRQKRKGTRERRSPIPMEGGRNTRRRRRVVVGEHLIERGLGRGALQREDREPTKEVSGGKVLG
ncbi:hypothetical protein AMTR_s00089p00176830 [Amborella trichopoda]|uniref:Uncharacterized protein n=1 Tax=Amborella trichopoda TaxID=13333 RepID=W1P2M6_AMBTC|nr:hypothetical protein AMTR_s00089p00176830 [Amborella trichopoda]